MKGSLSMCKRVMGSVIAGILCLAFAAASPAGAADNYSVDRVHSGVTFKIKHFDLAWLPGRFNEFSGNFTIDPADASKCSFALDIKATSVDTNEQKRNDHLRSPDFFNVKQFPNITFKSTSVKAIKGGYEVTGDLNMHGVTKPVTFALVGGGAGPKGRTGFSTELSLKRSEFGITGFPDMLSDEVHVAVAFEGTKS
jgi:polyisoprenoid-binding protein YceI